MLKANFRFNPGELNIPYLVNLTSGELQMSYLGECHISNLHFKISNPGESQTWWISIIIPWWLWNVEKIQSHTLMNVKSQTLVNVKSQTFWISNLKTGELILYPNKLVKLKAKNKTKTTKNICLYLNRAKKAKKTKLKRKC